MQKWLVCSVSCLSFLGLSTLVSNSASAQCVQADVSVQYNISGSREATNRTNDVNMVKDPNCSGNSSVTVGIQGNEGGRGRVEQHRRVNQTQQGGTGNATGINGTTVQIKPGVQSDIYNPAENFRR